MTSDEAMLIASQHDPQAFEPLVMIHGAALHAYLARRSPPGLAEDLLAEVWLAAFASRKTFNPRLGTARGWLFGVARHVLATHYRASRAKASRQGGVAPVDGLDEWAAVDTRLDAAAVAPRLRDALARLPADERELLLLVAWEQISPTEAAHALGIPAGTARSRLHRARARMRERLSDQ